MTQVGGQTLSTWQRLEEINPHIDPLLESINIYQTFGLTRSRSGKVQISGIHLLSYSAIHWRILVQLQRDQDHDWHLLPLVLGCFQCPDHCLMEKKRRNIFQRIVRY